MLLTKTKKSAPKEKSLYNFILKNRLLINKDSTKETYHLVLNCPKDAQFDIGDSIALYPKNPLNECSAIAKEPLLPVQLPDCNTTIPLIDYLQEHVQLRVIPKPLLRKTNSTLNPENGMSAFLKQHKLPLEEVIPSLRPMLPRYYSIASCPHEHPGEIHLLITLHNFDINGKKESGLFSSFITKKIPLNTSIEGYIQKTPHFKPPEKGPMIMIGPGTGIAPFKGFLERRIRNKQYQNWLFFGERHRATDFYYQDYLTSIHNKNLAIVETAFSRDQEQKIYVQDLLYQSKKKLIEWIDQGAPIYICGDAKRMAKDVTETLKRILQEEKNLTPTESNDVIKSWRNTKRLVLDVY